MKVFEIILAISLEVLLLTTENNGQDVSFPECDPSRVTWHPHPYACTRYILCFHGNPSEFVQNQNFKVLEAKSILVISCIDFMII